MLILSLGVDEEVRMDLGDGRMIDLHVVRIRGHTKVRIGINAAESVRIGRVQNGGRDGRSGECPEEALAPGDERQGAGLGGGHRRQAMGVEGAAGQGDDARP